MSSGTLVFMGFCTGLIVMDFILFAVLYNKEYDFFKSRYKMYYTWAPMSSIFMLIELLNNKNK